MRDRLTLFALLVLFLTLTACPGNKDGAVEGQVSPPGDGIRVEAVREGKVVSLATVALTDGRFRIPLPAGTYDIKITAPASPFPVMLSGIVVRAGDTTALAPIAIVPAQGAGRVAGKVHGQGAGTRVALLAEGVERASVMTAADGKYEFEGVPGGRYTLQVASTGYAIDSAAVAVADNERSVQDFRLIYITAIEGIDWKAGTVRARGIGLPPKQAPTPTIRREMAKRAAIADAERNLVRIVELINVAPGQTLLSTLGEKTFSQKVQGFLQGYRIAVERDMDGGKIEVELEIPLSGPGGLSSTLRP